jgi:cytoskeletal protein CcmA (bactofilin family)
MLPTPLRSSRVSQLLEKEGPTMRQKRKKEEKKDSTSEKVKFFKNPLKTVDATLVSASSMVDGSIETKGNLIVSGSIKGNIRCNSLEIMEEGKVDAIVETQNASVAGNFTGEIRCNGKLIILNTGKMVGKISYGSLSIESGGLLSGTLSRVETRETEVLPFYQGDIQSQ